MYSEIYYQQGFEEGVKTAWEVYSQYLKDFIDDAVKHNQPLSQIDFENYINALSKDEYNVFYNPDEEKYYTLRYSDKAYQKFKE